MRMELRVIRAIAEWCVLEGLWSVRNWTTRNRRYV